jgi:hypothetical protein
MRFLGCAAIVAGLMSAAVAAADPAEEKRWQEVYDARAKFYEASFGKLPSDILKIGHMAGVWPGGGLFVIPAEKLGRGLWVYTTFGFSNTDMPTTVGLEQVATKSEGGRVTETSLVLKKKDKPRPRTARPGYGYEFIVVAREDAEWPLWLLQWAANAEILNDADFPGRVERHGGMTIEGIRVGEREEVNILITRAQAPLPAGTKLPNGTMEILVATVITEDEMRWSIKNGRIELLRRLQAAGVGQISVRDRPSVLR